MIVKVKDAALAKAAGEGMDEFVQVIVDATYEAIGGELTAETMGMLNADQITLLAYIAMREEMMDGGFVQLIHNGWGHFIFHNPFDKAVRGWGLPELCSLIRRAHNSIPSIMKRSSASVTTTSLWPCLSVSPSLTTLMTSLLRAKRDSLLP